MYVIYPADELILMTYGFFAPRVKPRPSLDCLPEPLIPLEYPARAANSANANANAISSSNNNKNNNSNNFTSAAATSYPNDSFTVVATAPPQPIPIRIPATFAAPTPPSSPHNISNNYDYNYSNYNNYNSSNNNNNFFNFEQSKPSAVQSQSLPPTPTRRTSRASLTHSNHNSGGSKRSSVRSNRSRAPLSPQLPHQRPLSTSMYNNDASMQGGSNSAAGRAPFQRSSAYDEERLDDFGAGAGASGTGSVVARSRSPSIFLEPPSPDPTHAHFGPGWGRPMSPMDLPPERSTSSGGNKSPTTSKSRLRPKLHIPLGRLGRSTSSDTRESNRLREDVHVHVENPVFSSENLRQNNFDAFFEAREPVIKLHPRTPNTASPDGRGYSPPLENYAGVYDSPRTRSPAGSTGGGLFARSTREERERALNARSRSADHWDEMGAGGSAGAAGATAGAPASAGGGAHSKGDRCPQKLLFHKLIKLFTVSSLAAAAAAAAAQAAKKTYCV
ncbi:GH20237 [Drosophila grimshawi]|uniref:GH20237 n=1 Tax=Drosophila grimshawi TaxID=7222 RepID=B4J5P8_DROGR|nr:GH20237 [Drosophila grimshawi]